MPVAQHDSIYEFVSYSLIIHIYRSKFITNLIAKNQIGDRILDALKKQMNSINKFMGYYNFVQVPEIFYIGL